MQEGIVFSGFCEGIKVIFEVIGSFDTNREYGVIPIKESGSVVPVRVLGRNIKVPEPIPRN
jgi:hypothetical protein